MTINNLVEILNKNQNLKFVFTQKILNKIESHSKFIHGYDRRVYYDTMAISDDKFKFYNCSYDQLQLEPYLDIDKIEKYIKLRNFL